MKVISFKISLIIFIGIIIQLSFLFLFMEPNVLEWSDPKDYFSIASQIANGESYSANLDNLYRSPGYPYFLSILILILGPNILLIRLAHILFFSFFIFGSFKLGELWLSKEFGLLLALLSSLYPYFIYIPLTLYPEALLIYISPWILYYFLKLSKNANFFNLLISSIILSIGVLTRPTYLGIGFIFTLFNIFSQNSFVNKIKITLFTLIVPFLIILGWGFRNYLVHDHFIISTAANINLYSSYNENSTIFTKSTVERPKEFVKKLECTSDIFEQDSLFKSEAVKYIKDHPGRSFFLACIKCLDLWNPIPHTVTDYPFYKKIIASVPFLIVVGLSLFGFYQKRRDKFIILLFVILLFNTLTNGVFAVSIRYRVIFDIILLLTAGFVLYNYYHGKTLFIKLFK